MFWWRFVECKSFSGVKPFTFFRSIHSSKRLNDYYALLGLKKSATQREIKAAYYQLSKKFHPDVAGSSKDAAQKFLDISEAYECLRDPNRRRVYDNQTTGGGGRYTGDYGQDPFGNYTSRPFDRRYGNPFHSRQFTQEEYERIWREFNRLKNERSNYDERINSERQRMWAEFNRNRAARWNEFHKRYPEGPPGSFRFEWRFHNNNSEQQRLYNGWELLRKIMMIYFVSFFVISLVKIVLQSAGNARDNFIPSEANKIPLTEKEKLANIMNTMPISDKEKINAVMEKVPISKYPVNSSENGLNITYVPSNEIASGHSEIGQNISYVPQSSPSLNSGYTNSENNSEFSMYQNETSRKTY